MRVKLLVAFISCLIVGCAQDDALDQVETTNVDSEVRDVTFVSHLHGDLASDPTIRVGERIRVTPDSAEPFAVHDAIVVQLPIETPFEQDNELFFLRGYAIGQLSANNGQFR